MVTPQANGLLILQEGLLKRKMQYFSIFPPSETSLPNKMQLIYTVAANMALALVEAQMNYAQPCNR